MVITHELSGVENRSLHLTKSFHPYPVFYTLGRSAKMGPKCPDGHCLWYTWQESVRVHWRLNMSIFCQG